MSVLYALGSNGFGQLGVGHTEDSSIPQPVEIGVHGAQSAIKSIATGGNHTLVLFENGVVLSCGNNENGQCAQNERCIYTASRLTEIQGPSFRGRPIEIEHVAATWSASVFVDRGQNVYTTGQGLSGELGLGQDVTQVSTPTLVSCFPPMGSRIVGLSSCMAHTIATLSTGEVYGWGRGRQGQLGERGQNVWQPRKIEGIPFHVVNAVCGKDFTCILGSAGQVMMLGPNRLDRFSVKAQAPKNLLDNSITPNVVASWGSVVVLTFRTYPIRLQAWGRNDHGQLPPEQLPSLRALAAGSEHCLAITTSGQVLAWGWGEHGNCGLPVDTNGDVKGRWNVIELPRHAIKIFAGCATSFVVIERGVK